MSLPDAELLAKLSPLPEGFGASCGTMKDDPVGEDLGDIDGVVLPYLTPEQCWGLWARSRT